MTEQKTDWNDIHVAFQVANHGTLSAAAEALGVHHSTVLRRVNALEKRLGTRLFHRHPRGYTPTEAGMLLTQVAENTQAGFDRLLGKLQGTDTQLSGTLVVTTVNSMISNLMPMLAEFQQLYPQVRLEYAADSRIMKLEYGEAHVSIRPGTRPTDPDYVVQRLAEGAASIYADDAYIAQHGLMESLDDIEGHRFIRTVAPYSMIAFMEWMNKTVPDSQISLRVNDLMGFIPAIRAGFGAAPLPCWMASTDPSLKPLITPPPEWTGPMWLVTHVDLHRSSKVQAFTQFLKQRIQQEQSRLMGLPPSQSQKDTP
ncbi:LysR family transcriptional regulator [Motiliproteus coralliicola]|uniref:LysR family transcriptional regulator n=1 Tax=Motiliproteus coralliicola TaxID=2283196 RepID=A0A369WRA1_9GAMM|nr:LysR family transcriptional regulator [Motiliproteus coralliicola]RDE23076.1 LysR family transcriptional regulator [Motiliproteus coralliicola]